MHQCFDVDESHMYMTMKKVGKAAREFRANLSKECFDDEGNPILTPPAKYTQLKVVKDSWLGFVEAVGGERFKKMSESNSKSSKNKSHKLHLGALGYAQLRKQMTAQLDKELHTRQRLILWKEARRGRDGKIEDDVQRVVDEGESITETLTSEELLCRGPNDVLSKAIKKEYHERVLTAGHGVTKREYFRKRRDSSNDAEVHRLTQLVLEMGKQIQVFGSQVHGLSQAQTLNKDVIGAPSVHVSPIGRSDQASCPTDIPEVSILNVSKEKSVAQSVTPVTHRKPAYPREGDLEPYACFLVCRAYAENNNKNDSFDISMPESFWGVAFEDHVSFENVREVIKRSWLGASTICLYIRYLCDVYLVDKVPSRFSFISPHMQLEHTHSVDILQKYEGQDHLIMIPCNIGNHWVLVSINTKTEYIYYMDPLRVHHSHTSRADLVQKINSVMNSYQGTKKQSVSSRKKLSQNHWVSIECPKQDPFGGYCGFFICLFMEDILESGSTSLSLAYPQKHRCEIFADRRITHVQHEWCGYLYNKFLKSIT